MPKPDGTPEWWEIEGGVKAKSMDPGQQVESRGFDPNTAGRAGHPGQASTSSFDKDMAAAGKWAEGAYQDVKGEFFGGKRPGDVQVAGYGGSANDAQLALIQQLQDQSTGNGPSLANMQLQQATDQNMSQAMALGASQRGAGQAGMLKGIQGQQAGMAQQAAGQSAITRLQEQRAAQGQLGQVSGQRLQMQQERALAQARLDQEKRVLEAEAAEKNSIGGFIGGIFS